MHTVAILPLDGVLAFDLSTPVEVFGRARLPDGRRAYAVRVCAPTGEVDANVFALRAPWGLDVLAVMPLERDGGQAQFIVHEQPGQDGSSLEPLLRWMRENVHTDLSLHDIAVRAKLSTRTLNRRFREQTGTTPLRWLRRTRIRRSQYLLETTTHPVERISRQVGFNSPASFRGQFKALVGTSPQTYRRAFQGSDQIVH